MSYEQIQSEFNDVNEPLSIYIKSVSIEKGSLSFFDFFQDKMLVINAIRKGLPYKIFNQIKNFVPFSDNDWASYLDISLKSLQRYRDDVGFYFKPIHTEKILELAEVTTFGVSVFGNSEQFYSWLKTPSYAFNNLKPAELIRDSYGKEMVMAELNCIEYGIFA